MLATLTLSTPLFGLAFLPCSALSSLICSVFSSLISLQLLALTESSLVVEVPVDDKGFPDVSAFNDTSAHAFREGAAGRIGAV